MCIARRKPLGLLSVCQRLDGPGLAVLNVVDAPGASQTHLEIGRKRQPHIAVRPLENRREALDWKGLASSDDETPGKKNPL